MKRADLIAAGVLAVLSVYLMIKSMELPIGWLRGEGPGGGAFPFWLSVAMLVCSLLIGLRNILGASPEGRSQEIFVEADAAKLFFIALISLSAMIALIHVIGVYFAVPLFLVFYLKVLGKHAWPMVLVVAIATPVCTFLLFEKLLLILLPKGVTEEWFYIFY